MKTLTGTFVLVVLTAIVALTFVSCPFKRALRGQKFILFIEPYAEVVDEPGFKKALRRIKDKQGVCDIKFLRTEGGTLDEEYCKHLDVSLRTDKVTKSEFASRAADGGAAANDPHSTQKVASPDPTDIIEVLKTLK